MQQDDAAKPSPVANAPGFSSDANATEKKKRPPDKRAKRAPTARARLAFIEALAECGVVLYACERSGIERRKAYWLREVDTEFGMAWDQAVNESTERLEREAIRRAHDGVPTPVYYKGDVVGTIQTYSDRLMEFLLASRDDKFRVRRVEMTGKDGGPINVADEAESIRSKLLHDAAESGAREAITSANE